MTPETQKVRARQILEILRKNLSIRDDDFASLRIEKESADPFRVLVVTILSQNCTDKAALRAYATLEQQVGVTPRNLGQASVRDIRRAIRAAGLYKQKARALRRLGKIIVQRFSGNLNGILQEPVDQARLTLQELPQIGPKTADVLLSVYGKSTISVDTHVNRVSKRLGLAPPKANYEDTRNALMQLYRPRDYRLVPLLFMAHGRKTCKAIRPRCSSCPVEKLCPYTKKILQR